MSKPIIGYNIEPVSKPTNMPRILTAKQKHKKCLKADFPREPKNYTHNKVLYKSGGKWINYK